jgi:hypothetical protein
MKAIADIHQTNHVRNKSKVTFFSMGSRERVRLLTAKFDFQNRQARNDLQF